MENGGTVARIGFCCVIAGGGAALSVAACTDGPGVEQINLVNISQAFCEKSLECGCAPLLGDIGFVPPTSCEGWNLDQLIPENGYDEYGNDEYGGGYEGQYEGGGEEDTAGGDITHNFDQDCADRLAEALRATSCDRLIPEISCADYCKLFYGTRFEGQPCDQDRDCAQGLVCLGECRDPCKLQTVGEGESCEFARCEPGLDCVVTSGGEEDLPPVCVRRDGGDFCGEQLCTSTQWCDTNDPDGPRCRSRGGAGAACSGHAQCTTLYCPAGFCRELPGEGEPCSVDGECRDGALCVQSEADPMGTCLAVAPLCGAVIGIPFLFGTEGYSPYYY